MVVMSNAKSYDLPRLELLSEGVRLSPALSGEVGTLAVPQTLPPLSAPIALVVACSDRTLAHNVLYH